MPTTSLLALSTRQTPVASSTRCVSGYRSLHCRSFGEDPADRVWTLRDGKPQAARARQTGDLHLPGLHLYLQQNSAGQIPNQTEVPAGPHADKVASHQTGIATEHASTDSPAGKMVAAGRHRLLQLPRGADKRSDTDRLPLPRHQSLAAHATVAEPERLDDLGADQAVGRRLAPATANPSSVARAALRR